MRLSETCDNFKSHFVVFQFNFYSQHKKLFKEINQRLCAVRARMIAKIENNLWICGDYERERRAYLTRGGYLI